jgi:hypothetical protein
MITEQEAMKLCGTSIEDLDRRAEKYENETYENSDGKVYVGSHIDRVGTKRVTVIFDAEDTQQVNAIASNKGVKPSVIYRDALKFFLKNANV